MSGRGDRFAAALDGVRPETDLERRIVDDPAWLEGAAWGRPRGGHPEGMVLAHVLEVLANVDAYARGEQERERLRLVALIHDTFKHLVDRGQQRTNENHHAMIARRFAERFVDDPSLLELIELHDEASNAWCVGARDERRWEKARARALRLIERLGPGVEEYLCFYRADNETGSKDKAPFAWFEELARAGAGMPGDGPG